MADHLDMADHPDMITGRAPASAPGTGPTIGLAARVDARTVAHLELLLDAVDPTSADEVRLDASRVRFVDDGGLAALRSTVARYRTRGLDLVVVDASRAAELTFDRHAFPHRSPRFAHVRRIGAA
ncbi:MAG: STAS domain-containing protein [Actinomycetota bacterium]|nr:STAS domain-containing protein [Actinomycetota bacterium]